MPEAKTLTVAASPNADSGSRLIEFLTSAWSWLFLALLLVFFEIWARADLGTSFVFNTHNLRSIGIYAVLPLLLALGQTYVIISGGIDLSVGYTVGFAAVVVALFCNLFEPLVGMGAGFIGAVVVTVLACAAIGAVNGILIAWLRVPPFIGTLGMYGVARGIGFLVADGTRVPVRNDVLFELGNGRLFGEFPIPILVAIVALLVMHYVLRQTRFGQYTYAIGGNRAAAVRSGVKVKRQTLYLYILAAVFAGLAGIIYTGRFSAGSPDAGEPLLLNAIAAVVIGGASLFGGSGNLIGTLIGSLIIAVIEYGLVFINLPPFYQFIGVGFVIIISVLIDQSRSKLTGERASEEG
ncbi:MAG: ABC transporter permease [Alphaproteobacteria bacterium]